MPIQLNLHPGYVEAVKAGRQSASIYFDRFVYPRHILLGLIETTNIVSHLIKKLLQENGATLADLKEEIEDSLSELKKANQQRDPNFMKYHENTQKVFEFADVFAASEGYTLVCCHHLLLGIYEQKGKAAEILKNMYVDRRCIERWLTSTLSF